MLPWVQLGQPYVKSTYNTTAIFLKNMVQLLIDYELGVFLNLHSGLNNWLNLSKSYIFCAT